MKVRRFQWFTSAKLMTWQQRTKFTALVWNQDIVPFLLVRTPAGLRLYSGFKCNDTDSGEREGILEPLIQFNEIADRLAEFRAERN